MYSLQILLCKYSNSIFTYHDTNDDTNENNYTFKLKLSQVKIYNKNMKLYCRGIL